MKIFHIARSYEVSKAYLASYGLLIIYPSIVISAVRKGGMHLGEEYVAYLKTTKDKS